LSNNVKRFVKDYNIFDKKTTKTKQNNTLTFPVAIGLQVRAVRYFAVFSLRQSLQI